jgi:predicted transposase YbfD/YdcC
MSKKITKKIIEGGANYIIAVKGNQKALHDDIKYFFDESEKENFKLVDSHYYEDIDKGHRRIETRHYWLTNHFGCLNK